MTQYLSQCLGPLYPTGSDLGISPLSLSQLQHEMFDASNCLSSCPGLNREVVDNQYICGNLVYRGVLPVFKSNPAFLAKKLI